MGGFTAFTVAPFTEMYGFPLTIHLLTGALGSRLEPLTLTHDGGHLWSELIGWQGDPHVSLTPESGIHSTPGSSPS